MNVIDLDGRLVAVADRRREIPRGPLPLAVVLVLRDAIILGLLAEGYTAPQVAQLLNLTARTVERRIKLSGQADDAPDLADPSSWPRMDRWT